MSSARITTKLGRPPGGGGGTAGALGAVEPPPHATAANAAARIPLAANAEDDAPDLTPAPPWRDALGREDTAPVNPLARGFMSGRCYGNNERRHRDTETQRFFSDRAESSPPAGRIREALLQARLTVSVPLWLCGVVVRCRCSA